MRILIALPGIHRYDRGAEIAFMAVAQELAKSGDKVTLVGSGDAREGTRYRFLHAGSLGDGNISNDFRRYQFSETSIATKN